MGETGFVMHARTHENKTFILISQLEKSAVADHHFELVYMIEFEIPLVLTKTRGLFERMMRKAVGIHLNKENFTKNYSLSDIQKGVLNNSHSL